MRILVADDDRVSQRIMERMLQGNGYEVVCAANGREAADILARPGSPRLALINWMMPELDGPGVCRETRARRDEAYVYMILLTSKQLSEDIVKGLEAGADDYLTKPCHPAELKARLHTGRRILQLEDKLVEAREEMRFKATHDSLTSLWDRGALLRCHPVATYYVVIPQPTSLRCHPVAHLTTLSSRSAAEGSACVPAHRRSVRGQRGRSVRA